MTGDFMANALDFGKFKKVLKIYSVVQVLLVALLVFVAFYFQQALAAKGHPEAFYQAIVIGLVIQLVIFYPMNKYAGADALRELDASTRELSVEEAKALRQRRLYSDFLKGVGFIFFFTFISLAPVNAFILATIFFSFIFCILTYFQCFNFAAKRAMQGKR